MDPTPYVPRAYEDRIFKELPLFSDVFLALDKNPVPETVHEQIRCLILPRSVRSAEFREKTQKGR